MCQRSNPGPRNPAFWPGNVPASMVDFVGKTSAGDTSPGEAETRRPGSSNAAGRSLWPPCRFRREPRSCRPGVGGPPAHALDWSSSTAPGSCARACGRAPADVRQRLPQPTRSRLRQTRRAPPWGHPAWDRRSPSGLGLLDKKPRRRLEPAGNGGRNARPLAGAGSGRSDRCRARTGFPTGSGQVHEKRTHHDEGE